MSKRAVAFVHTRDIPAEQALVREKWELVHANVKLDKALTAFLTQSLDLCGQTITHLAFELVQQILDPEGYVRLDHKSELSNIGAVVQNSGSAWGERGQNIATRWDFGDAWKRRMNKWRENYRGDQYTELKPNAVKKFCDQISDVQLLNRTQKAEYTNQDAGQNPDQNFSLEVFDKNQNLVKVFAGLPCQSVCRWQIKHSKLKKEDLKNMYTGKQYKDIEKELTMLEPYWRFALRIKQWKNNNGDKGLSDENDGSASQGDPAMNQPAQPVAMNQPVASALAESSAEISQDVDFITENFSLHTDAPIPRHVLEDIKKINSEKDVVKKYEKYRPVVKDWNEFLDKNLDKLLVGPRRKKEDQLKRVCEILKTHDIDGLNGVGPKDAVPDQDAGEPPSDALGSGTVKKLREEYGFMQKHRPCSGNDKPDVVLKVGYFSKKTGLYRQRCVIAEIDGHDKTKKPDPDGKNVDSIKLAQKLMSSTSVQAVLQPETYHIRSNLHHYLIDFMKNSLLATTNVELPDFEEFIKTLSSSGKSNEMQNFLEAVHWVHHLFLSHVKIAFLIHMREAENIDMLSYDIRDERMSDHYFFVNFTGKHLPDELKFQHYTDVKTKEFLEDQLMLLTRPKIKYYNTTTGKSEWTDAPVVNASTTRANMYEWHAKVRHMQVPLFPYEDSRFMHIACATVQRVDMTKLCEIVSKAAQQALDDYNDARKLRDRGEINPGVQQTTKSREFPDRHFLTRKQQFDRSGWWNQGGSRLRDCSELDPTQDKIEFNWGYETPERKTSYDEYDPRWDQIDVRMHFFHNQMMKTDWEKAAGGMWFIQDYADFMEMLQHLHIPDVDEDLTCTEIKKFQLPNTFKSDGTQNILPKNLQVHNRACHRFSVLAWFFDCRDAGACRYEWENFVLDYFGAFHQQDKPSLFEIFAHKESMPEPQWAYFEQPWFEIVLFLEHNFRNAIATMHYKLFDFQNLKKSETKTLQATAKTMFNRRTSMLNNRSVFAGLQVGNQNCESLLSFRRYHPTSNGIMTLRERLMSQLHDELPRLDPFLQEYIMQFRIPDAELFLRMIRCPNVLALRELAVQHRHLLGGQNTASSVQPLYHLQSTLQYFPIAVQSEILYMLKFVERDDSVYVHSPAIHEHKLMLISSNLMLRWIQHILEVSARKETLRTPLQIKCYMFTMPTAFHRLKTLFYTSEAMMNYGSKRAVVFVLLQMRLALLMFKCCQKQYSNPVVDFFEAMWTSDVVSDIHDYTYQTTIWKDSLPVPWTPGTCLKTWPRRDTNNFVLPCKNTVISVAVSTNLSLSTNLSQTSFDSSPFITQAPQELSVSVETTENTCQNSKIHYLLKNRSSASRVNTIDGVDEKNPDMLEEERCLWLLLMYARPQLHNFTTEDMTIIRCEDKYDSPGNNKNDTIVATLTYEVSDHKLICTVQDDITAPLFFEQVAQADGADKFPEYLQAIISTVPNRKYIYVPDVFAKQLREHKKCLHNIVFEHDTKWWKMVCVGMRSWAWKRLMIKSTFFNAFQKIMTRSSVQLSLYGPVSGKDSSEEGSKKDLETLLKRHHFTQAVFGELQEKQELLKANYKNKQVQLVFTACTKTHRKGKIDNVETNFDQQKIPDIIRQVKFVKHFRDHFDTLTNKKSCRFMLVDARIGNQLKQSYLDTPKLDARKVLLYRSYLYTPETLTSNMLEFQNQFYIKFPFEYAVIRNGPEYATGTIQIDSNPFTYGTCFDTRTYSCLRYKQRLRADDDDVMELLQEITSEQTKLKEKQIPWPSTKPHNPASDCHKFIFNEGGNQTLFSSAVYPVISDIATDESNERLETSEQEHMYTLPDFFKENDDKMQKEILSELCENFGKQGRDQSWTYDIAKFQDISTHAQEVDAFIFLRCTTKKLISENNHILEFQENLFQNKLLKNVLNQIHKITVSSSSMDD